jgi:hypothetical protein
MPPDPTGIIAIDIIEQKQCPMIRPKRSAIDSASMRTRTTNSGIGRKNLAAVRKVSTHPEDVAIKLDK